MKQIGCMLLLGVLTGGGCVTLGKDWATKKPSTSEVPAKVVKPAKPVAPEQITENNAHDKAKALLEELDRDGPKPVSKTERP